MKQVDRELPLAGEPHDPGDLTGRSLPAAPTHAASRSERFHELLAGIGDEELDAIDARLADPNYVPREVGWRDDPDPFGMDWDWLHEQDGGE